MRLSISKIFIELLQIFLSNTWINWLIGNRRIFPSCKVSAYFIINSLFSWCSTFTWIQSLILLIFNSTWCKYSPRLVISVMRFMSWMNLLFRHYSLIEWSIIYWSLSFNWQLFELSWAFIEIFYNHLLNFFWYPLSLTFLLWIPLVDFFLFESSTRWHIFDYLRNFIFPYQHLNVLHRSLFWANTWVLEIFIHFWLLKLFLNLYFEINQF